MKRIIVFFVLISLGFLIISFISKSKCKSEQEQWFPPNGFVPNDTTARKIAEAVLIPIYGDEILNQKPFNVELVGDSVWVVTGTQKEIVALTGVAYIEIRKKDCKILKVTHGK